MCFQGFAHHTCGCTKVFEVECDYAKELEAPFYLKVACPNYSIAGKHSAFDCGKGGLYCANVPDAPYLDYIYDLKTKHEADVMYLDKQIDDVIHPRRKMVLDALEKTHAGDLSSIRKAYQSSSHYMELDRAWNAMLEKKKELVGKIGAAVDILRYARDFYLLQRQMPGYSVGDMPVLPDCIKNVHATTLNLTRPTAISTAPPLPAPGTGMGMGTTIDVNNGFVQPQPRRLHSLRGPDPFGRPPLRAEGDQETEEPSIPAPPVKASPRKRGGKSKKAKAVEDDAEDAPSEVRRSTRVRGNKVDYNETSDDYRSATSSPEKSDVSTYSPTKSDASYPGPKVSRGSSSLRDMIGEYQKQSSNISTPTRRPSSRSQPGSASSQKRGLLDSVPQIRIESPRSDTPDTDILGPDDPRYDGGTLTPIQRNNSTIPYVQPAFRTLDDGNPDPALLAFQQAYQQTRLPSSTGFNGTSPGTFNGYGIPGNYIGNSQSQEGHSMPATNMSPPKLVQYQVPTDAAEPKKRPIPASSPILPSNKRSELSFPSSYITTAATSASSPNKPTYMQRQDSGIGFSSPPKFYNAPSASTSLMRPPSQAPPIFNATTRTFKPSGLSQVIPVQDVFTTSAIGSSSSDGLPSTNADTTQSTNEISDLDWQLLSDGSKF